MIWQMLSDWESNRFKGSISKPPDPLVPPALWEDFCDWAKDCGYDESCFNRHDSQSLIPQREYLDFLKANLSERKQCRSPMA